MRVFAIAMLFSSDSGALEMFCCKVNAGSQDAALGLGYRIANKLAANTDGLKRVELVKSSLEGITDFETARIERE